MNSPNKGADFMPRCLHPGCNARTMRGAFCARHRPKIKQAPRPWTEARNEQARRAAKRREQAGVPPGWELA